MNDVATSYLAANAEKICDKYSRQHDEHEIEQSEYRWAERSPASSSAHFGDWVVWQKLNQFPQSSFPVTAATNISAVVVQALSEEAASSHLSKNTTQRPVLADLYGHSLWASVVPAFEFNEPLTTQVTAAQIIQEYVSKRGGAEHEAKYQQTLCDFIENHGIDGLDILYDAISKINDHESLWQFINITNELQGQPIKQAMKPKLLELVNHKSPGVRNAVAAALGAYKDSDAKAAIDVRLKSETNKFVLATLKAHGTKL